MTSMPHTTTDHVWSLPDHVTATRGTRIPESTQPDLATTHVVMPMTQGRARRHDVVYEMLASCAGMVAVVNGFRTDASVASHWPHAVEVVTPHPMSAAHARNVGISVVRMRGAKWVWLVDDDCSPWRADHQGALFCVQELVRAWRPGMAAIQGRITQVGVQQNPLRRFVEATRLFSPPHHALGPQGLVTANVLLHVASWEAVGGFDDEFPGAGGEDIDLGVRLLQGGRHIGESFEARVMHEEFAPSELNGRMRRYGHGMRRFARKHDAEPDLIPKVEGHRWCSHGKLGRDALDAYVDGWTRDRLPVKMEMPDPSDDAFSDLDAKFPIQMGEGV